jgi:hypothetical protein
MTEAEKIDQVFEVLKRAQVLRILKILSQRLESLEY